MYTGTSDTKALDLVTSNNTWCDQILVALTRGSRKKIQNSKESKLENQKCLCVPVWDPNLHIGNLDRNTTLSLVCFDQNSSAPWLPLPERFPLFLALLALNCTTLKKLFRLPQEPKTSSCVLTKTPFHQNTYFHQKHLIFARKTAWIENEKLLGSGLPRHQHVNKSATDLLSTLNKWHLSLSGGFFCYHIQHLTGSEQKHDGSNFKQISTGKGKRKKLLRNIFGSRGLSFLFSAGKIESALCFVERLSL